MQGPYLLGEANAAASEFAFFLVDAGDLSTPETGEAGGQPEIRKPGSVVWVSTSAILTHIGDGHYIIALTTAELDTVGTFGVRYKSDNTAEFQDTGTVSATAGDASLAALSEQITMLGIRMGVIEYLLDKVEKDTESKQFVSPL